ncbi:hypothetical protein CEP52_013157 [Fusarium oligoseptatum]|uniref:Uncharacterized protein n=1 Tax=Fusarium oligoseptatum TaxID=2604345 RepID=A0A428SUV2_9HYPO|nr:hypothetical protein CEP52_013157 [Fusarium oligoseptatum]
MLVAQILVANMEKQQKEGLVAKSKDEAPLTGNERIAFWREKMKKQGGDQDAPLAKDDDGDDNGISEDWDLTPLHKLLQDSQDDDYCSRELEKRLDEWKNIVDIRSPERQETALDMAVQKGFNKTARQLLTAMAEVNIEDGSGELPLQLACDSGDEQLVKMLLENGADPNKTVGGAHWTPLNNAIYDGHENVVDALLEGGASLRIQDSDGWTPLMTAIRARQHNTFHKLLQHLKRDPTEWDVINTPDNNGRTPLMQLCADEPGESTAHAIEHLFGMNPDVDITDEEGMTVLHHTMISFSYRRFTETNPYEGVALELVGLLSVERLLHLDKDGETAFDIAFDENKQSQIPAFELLLNSLVGRLVKDEFIEEPLCWAVYRLERHMFALDLFQKNFADDIRQDPDREQWAIVEWAIYARMPRVLQTYLRTLGVEKVVSEDDKIDRSIRNGRKLIKALREKGRKISATLTEGKKRNEDRGLTSGDDSSQDAEVLRDMEDILDYLYPEKAKKPTKPLELSKPDEGMKASLGKFRAAIIQSTFVKFRTIQDILNSVVHQPTTLDEFYYQFASDKDSVEDKNTRNKDQVVTKYLQRRDIKEQRFWPLLRVGQLWIWTIDEKWLITSTSCATNDRRDNLVTDILGHLQRQVENGSRRLGPTSATEMSRVIVDYCIGTYERKRKRQTGGTTAQDQHQVNTHSVDQSATEDEKHKEERSIHQIFSDSINEIAQSSLFSLSYGRQDYARAAAIGPNSPRTSERMNRLQDALHKVSVQLCQIKDIRDELNILKSIARFQRKVQSTMAGSKTKEELSSYYLLRDIDELDKVSNQTQEAIKTALTLQESDIARFQAEIANLQASEAVRQGNGAFMFGLVTVWFVPLSFLTSLFALDVESFMKTPGWTFCVIWPGVNDAKNTFPTHHSIV